MERILVPLDGSPLAEAALPVATSLGGHPGSGLRLVWAVGLEVPLDAQDAGRDEARAYLARTARLLEARGLPDVGWAVWDGEPVPVILNAATRERATLIAMSTHGRSGIERLRFGSVAEGVARLAPVPVLLVRSATPWLPGPGAPILVPLDGSQRSEAVLPVVERLMVPYRVTVALLHAVEPGPAVGPSGVDLVGGDEPRRIAEAEAYLAEVAARLEARGLHATRSVQTGFPVDVIERAARATPPSLIAMSTHGRTGLGRLLLGSVAEHVARGASVPVLLWKAPVGGTRRSS
jgi:nucleotide-binding universal stress UspA family protein